MRETIEFRIDEGLARRFLDPNLGTPLSDTLRRVVLPTTDERVQQIGELQRAHRKKGGFFFIYWDVRRKYSEKELQAAELLHMNVRAVFEPTGEECGTTYDESTACKRCGAGADQTSGLILDTRRIPKGKDIARTIGGEIVVSRRFADAFRKKGLQGAAFQPVLHRGRGSLEPSEWSQLVVTSNPVKLSTRTVTGNTPFDLDEQNEHRCPKGHTAGLTWLSELFVLRSNHDGGDLIHTEKMFGLRRGYLRPRPQLLISQKLRRVLVDMKAKGFELEAAHLV
jgi:hypothetical protein